MDTYWGYYLIDDLWRFWQNKRAMGLDIHIYSCVEDTHDGCGSNEC